MNDQNNEDLLALYYQSRSEQPSELLDQRIRKAAETAARRQRRQWIWGLSRVAVLVLSFSVVLRLWINQPSIEDLAEIPETSDLQISEALPKRGEQVSRKSEIREQSGVAADSVAGFSQAPAPSQKRKSMAQSEPALDSPATLKLETFSAELADEAMATAPMVALEEAVAAISIPELPADRQALEALGTGLTVEPDQAGVLTVYSGGKRILSVSENNSGVTFKAWQGSEVLGVHMNWMMRPEGLDNCTDQDDYLKCTISEQVVGYFSADRLEHIEWRQVQ